jgi:hypothetical protein
MQIMAGRASCTADSSHEAAEHNLGILLRPGTMNGNSNFESARTPFGNLNEDLIEAMQSRMQEGEQGRI